MISRIRIVNLIRVELLVLIEDIEVFVFVTMGMPRAVIHHRDTEDTEKDK